MNNKFISVILVVTLLNLAGCYSSQSVTVPEYKQVEEEEGKPDEIYVKTKDNQEYHFYYPSFDIENDTLYGKGVRIVSEKEILFEGELALSDIESIEIANMDWLKTSSLCIGLSPIILIIGLAIILALGGKWGSSK